MATVTQSAYSDFAVTLATTGINRVYYVDNGGAPSAGTYNTGDIAFPCFVPSGTAPTQSAPAYWRCTSGGSPGTWIGVGGGSSPQLLLTTLSGATDAIPPHTAATYVVTTAGVDAMTLAAPTATTDDGKIITVTSGSANAHTITATGLFQDGAATVNLATFGAHPGASITLMAYQAKWNVISTNNVTMS